MMSTVKVKKKSGFCIGCPACEFDKWVPHHPLFKCIEGGEMDTRSTKTVRCPKEKRGA